jgi:hypothetical protein
MANQWYFMDDGQTRRDYSADFRTKLYLQRHKIIIIILIYIIMLWACCRARIKLWKINGNIIHSSYARAHPGQTRTIRLWMIVHSRKSKIDRRGTNPFGNNVFWLSQMFAFQVSNHLYCYIISVVIADCFFTVRVTTTYNHISDRGGIVRRTER